MEFAWPSGLSTNNAIFYAIVNSATGSKTSFGRVGLFDITANGL